MKMSKQLLKATSRAIRIAEDEGMAIVGFAIPKDLDDGDFGWDVFTSITNMAQAEDLIITIADILREKPETVN